MGVHGCVERFKRGNEFLVRKRFRDYSSLGHGEPTAEDVMKKSYSTLTGLKAMGTSAAQLRTIEMDPNDPRSLILTDLSEGGAHEILDFMDVFDTENRELQTGFSNYRKILGVVMNDVGLMHRNRLVPTNADLWLVAKSGPKDGEAILVDCVEIYGEKEEYVLGRELHHKPAILFFLLGHVLDDEKLTETLLRDYIRQNSDFQVVGAALDWLERDMTHVELLGIIDGIWKAAAIKRLRERVLEVPEKSGG